MITILPPDLVPAVTSEVRKVGALRSNLLLAIALVAITLVASTVTSLVSGPSDPNSNPATGAASIGLYLGIAAAILAAAAFGAAGAGAEYRYQSISATALFTTDRDRLVAAKLLVTAGIALATTFVVELVGLACLLGFGGAESEFGMRLITVLGGGLLAAVCWSLIGTGLAILLRQSTGAIVLLLGWLLIAEPLIWIVANALGLGGLATLLPGSATIATVAVGSFTDSDILAPTPAAVVVLLLWTLGITGAGWWTLRTRDL
ncbi:ABC transporter permease [Nocardia sp. NPDC050710]|uniref:ABC transporter permease n=1 Tax=Nocardia sp. NPDC050710 TaxID=3157220 RepID=UPI0033C01206